MKIRHARFGQSFVFNWCKFVQDIQINYFIWKWKGVMIKSWNLRIFLWLTSVFFFISHATLLGGGVMPHACYGPSREERGSKKGLNSVTWFMDEPLGKFYENMAKTSFLMFIMVVIWSVTPTFYFFLQIFYFGKSLYFVLGTNSNHSNIASKKYVNKGVNVRFLRTMYDSILFISILSSVKVFFFFGGGGNGFGGPQRACYRNLRQFLPRSLLLP